MHHHILKNRNGLIRLGMSVCALVVLMFGAPIYTDASSSFYPEADGATSCWTGDSTWATIRSCNGTHAWASDDTSWPVRVLGGANCVKRLDRGMFTFDTSGLPDHDTISAATIKLYGHSGLSDADAFGLGVNFTGADPLNDLQVQIGDYPVARFGSTRFLDADVALSALTNDGYHTFTLNSAGRSNISKTGRSRFGFRFDVDVDNDASKFSGSGCANESSWAVRWADYAGTASDPVLTVTHGTPEVASDYGGTGNWYNDAWAYRKKITIDKTKVSGTLSNVPVLITQANLGAHFFNKVKSDGGDIVFTSGDGTTKLKRELVAINTSAQTMETWVLAPSLSSAADTDMYVYYGNATAAKGNDYGTWPNMRVVQHMHHNPSASAPQFIDGGTYGNDGTQSGNPTSASDVKIGGGLEFDRTDDTVDLSNDVSLHVGGSDTDVLWSSWIYPTDSGSSGQYNASILSRGVYDGGSERYDIQYHHSGSPTNDGWWTDGSNQRLVFRSRTNWTTYDVISVSRIQYDQWTHVAVTWDGTDIKMYINGVLDKTAAFSSSYFSGTKNLYTRIGSLRTSDGGGQNWWRGRLDEIRIGTIAESADWIATVYANQNAPSVFYSVATEESVPSTASDKLYMNGFTTLSDTEIAQLTHADFDDNSISFGTITAAGAANLSSNFVAAVTSADWSALSTDAKDNVSSSSLNVNVIKADADFIGRKIAAGNVRTAFAREDLHDTIMRNSALITTLKNSIGAQQPFTYTLNGSGVSIVDSNGSSFASGTAVDLEKLSLKKDAIEIGNLLADTTVISNATISASSNSDGTAVALHATDQGGSPILKQIVLQNSSNKNTIEICLHNGADVDNDGNLTCPIDKESFDKDAVIAATNVGAPLTTSEGREVVYVSSNDTFVFTSVNSGGGDGSPPVPEFTPLVYMATIMLCMWLLYYKTPYLREA